MSQPKIIKRYQNRKLYDTQASKYVTLDDIADMIKNGEDVMVIDNRSKDDLTGVTLAQIIYEEEKKKRTILPLDSLKKVIRSRGANLTEMAGKLIQPGIMGINQARDEFEKIISRLSKHGDIADEDGKGLLNELKESSALIQKRFEGSVQQLVDLVRGVSLLGRQVTELEDTVAKLEKEIKELKKKGVIKN